MRVYNLQELPAGLWYDEADNLFKAMRIQADPGSAPVFVSTLPALYLLPAAALVDLVGVTPATIRLVSVIFSLAGVIAVFLLARLLLGPLMGMVAAFRIAVTRWDLNFSRIGMHGITMTVSTSLVAYLTLRALRSGRISDFGYAGAALGIGMWLYASFQLFPLVLGVILLHHLVAQRPEPKRFLGRLLVMAVVALAVAAPVVQSAAVDPDSFFARTRTTSVFSHMPVRDAVSSMWTSLGSHALMFNYQGDPNPRHNLPGAPMLDFLSGVLLVLGLGVALAKWRDVAVVILPFWIFFMVLPGVLTLPWEAPQSLRSIGVLPAVVMAVTLALGTLWWAGRSAPWPAVRRATPVVLAALLGVIAYSNVNTYFGEQADHPEVYAAFSTDETLIARDMVQQQRNGYSLFVSRQFLHSLARSLLAPQSRYEVIRAPSGVPIDPARVFLGASIYLEPREAGVYRLLMTYYPEARFEEVRPPGGGKILYYLAVISREQLEQRKGLIARYELPDGTVRQYIQRTTGGARPAGLRHEDAPFDLVWTGALHVIEPGEYTLALQGDADAQVALDGERVLWSGRTSVRIEPAVGLHSLEVKGRVEDSGSALHLLWKPPDGQLEPIPPGHLYHGSVRPVGLAGRFFQVDVEGASVDAMRVTPAMSTFWYDPVVPEPYLGSGRVHWMCRRLAAMDSGWVAQGPSSSSLTGCLGLRTQARRWPSPPRR